jgi:hypothetical protein
MVVEFMSITMKGGVHENLHQTLHDCEKFEKSAMSANLPGQELVDLGVHQFDHEGVYHPRTDLERGTVLKSRTR